MATLIYENQIRTRIGTIDLRITDRREDDDTPALHNGDIIGSVVLEQGDTGASEDDIPIGIFGSFFDLEFIDTANSDFRHLFNQNFQEDRFKVELEFPPFTNLGTWVGRVKADLQQRSLSDRPRENVVRITCYDGLGGLKENDPIEVAFNQTVRQYLVNALPSAGDIPIVLYTDVLAYRPNDGLGQGTTGSGTARGMDELYPLEEPAHEYRPRSGTYDGLSGGSIYEQLTQLCETLHLAIYYDVRLSAWACMDIAAQGKPISADRYDGSWSAYTPPRNEVLVTESGLRDSKSDRIEPLPSAQKVCVPYKQWLQDPAAEQFPAAGTDKCYWWEHSNTDIKVEGGTNSQNETGSFFEDPDGDGVGTSFAVEIDVGEVDYVRASFKANDAIAAWKSTIEYADGTTDDKPSSGSIDRETLYHQVDKSKNTITGYSFSLGATTVSGINIFSAKVEFVESEQEVQQDGTTETVYQTIENICFGDAGDGRQRVEEEVYSLIISLDGGEKVTPQNYESKRYNALPFRLGRWRAINRLALQKPGIDRLKSTAISEILPMGTRVQYVKPSDANTSQFVPLSGRKLILSGEDGLGTELDEYQISDEVDQKIEDII